MDLPVKQWLGRFESDTGSHFTTKDTIMRLFLSLSTITIAAGLLMPIPAHANQTWATWYKDGRRTANGERFNPNGMTAAHRTLPFGTMLNVSYKGRSIVVRINDRGPFRKRVGLDLSRGAARAIGCSGKCLVSYRVV